MFCRKTPPPFFLLFFLFLSACIYGQGEELTNHPLYQSVLPTINNNQPDSFTVKMAQYFGSPQDSMVARVLIDKAMDRGIRTGSRLWELEAYHALSIFNSKNGDKKAALAYVRKAEPLLTYGTLTHRLQNYNLQGIYYNGLGEHEAAVDYYSRGIALLENATDKSANARVGATLYFNRSSFYYQRDEVLLALSDCLKALEYASLDEAATHGLEYRFMSRLTKIQRQFGTESVWKESLRKVAELALENQTPYDSAMAMTYLLEISEDVSEGEGYFERGMKLVKQHNLALPIHSSFLHQMSVLYQKHGMLRKQEALNKEIFSLYPDSSASTPALAIARLSQGRLKLEQGKYEEAVGLAEKVITSSQDLGVMEMQSDAITLLSEAYAAQNNYEAAYRSQIAQGVLQDSLKNKAEPTSLMQTYLAYQYDQEKKVLALKAEQEQALLNARVKRQQILIASTLLGLVLLIVLVGSLLSNIRIKRRSEQTLLQQQQVLLSSNERLKQFGGIVSHDILSNLDLIIASGNILVSKDQTSGQLQAYYKNTQRAAKELKKYCIDLLKMAEAPAPSVTGRDRAEAIVTDLLRHYAPSLSRLQFEVQTGPIPDLPIPAVVIEEFLHNSITNALKYVPQAGKTPRLWIYGYSDSTKTTYFCIDDNGPGIDQATKDAFLKGRRVQSTKEGRGTGLIKLKKHLHTLNLALEAENKKEGGLRLKMFGRQLSEESV